MAPNRTQSSQELLARLQRVSPGGAQTRSKRASVLPDTFPVLLRNGYGAKVWAENGGEYIDWICALGAISLGYAFQEVEHAVMQQHWRGVSFSLPHKLELEVSELFLDTVQNHGFPEAEQVRWVKTGSEATAGAMMIARRATKRKLILSVGYHGWHEEHQTSEDLCSQEWGRLDLIEDWFRYWGDSSAAVLLEACRDSQPPKDYLECIKEFCIQHGTLLILDECVTGFRWAIGGASEYFGLVPDLAVYGKGIANGYPLACVVGPARYMQHAVDISGTYGGEAVSLAACKATLEIYRKENVIGHMWEIGNMFKAAGVVEGYPCHPRLIGSKEEVFAKAGTAALGGGLPGGMGHLFHPSGFNISYSHSKADAKEAIEILKGKEVGSSQP